MFVMQQNLSSKGLNLHTCTVLPLFHSFHFLSLSLFLIPLLGYSLSLMTDREIEHRKSFQFWLEKMLLGSCFTKQYCHIAKKILLWSFRLLVGPSQYK